MKTVAVHIRSYVAMMTNIASQSKHIEVKTLFTNSWKRYLKRLNTVIKKQFNKPLVMTEDDEQCFITRMGVTFVVKSTLTKMCMLETIVTSLENSGAQLTMSVT